MPQTSRSFDFCEAMRLLCNDITRRLEVFRHIEMTQVGVSFAQTRSRESSGLQAKLTPLRFEKGSFTSTSKGRTWAIQPVRLGGCELLYILTFYLPRFLDQSLHEKLTTVVHELFHVSPEFDGDLRRLHQRYYAHSSRQDRYDEMMREFVDLYLASNPAEDLIRFLEGNFESLKRERGRVLGVTIPVPKIFAVDGK